MVRMHKQTNTKKIFSALIFLLVLNGLFVSTSRGTPSEWTMFHHDLIHTGYTSASAPNTNHTMWTYQTGDKVCSSPVIADGKMYVGADDGYVYCLDAENGTEIWKSSINGVPWMSSPAIADGRLYIGGYGLYCLNVTDGRILWNYPTGLHVSSSPAVVGNRVYVGIWNQGVCCFNTHPLLPYERIWQFKPGTMVLSSPAVLDDRVYIGSREGKLYCINATTGVELWNFTTSIGGWVDSSPAISNGRLFFGSDDNKIYCISPTNGEKIWEYTTQGEIRSTPAVSGDRVYVGSMDKKLYCLHSVTGELLWSYMTGGSIDSSPAVADQKIYVGSHDKKIYCLDAISGVKLWEYQTGGAIEYSSPALSNGKLYIGSSDTSIYCFGDLPPSNHPPQDPTIPVGPQEGTINEEYTFTTISSDPDGDQIYYLFDWGDTTTSGWINTPSLHHLWTIPGTYLIQVKAKDIFNVQSQWSPQATITITAPVKTLIIATAPSVNEGDDFQITVTANNMPIENVQITFNNHMKMTDSLGKTTFTAPLVTQTTLYTITATKDGFTPAMQTIRVINQNTFSENGFIYGVISSTSGTLLSEAQIGICLSSEETKYTTSDATGRYVLAAPPGVYTLIIRKDGYTSQTLSGIAVIAKNAIEQNVVLNQLTSPPEQTGTERKLVEYAIQEKITQGVINARVDVNPNGSTVSYYVDDIKVDTASYQQTLSFTVSAPDNTTGTVLVVRIGEGVLADLDNLRITYDDETISETTDVTVFFDLQHNQNPGWLRFSTTTGVYLFIRIPHFSEHTIIIESLQLFWSGIMAVVLFITFIGVASTIFAVPVYHLFFRKPRE